MSEVHAFPDNGERFWHSTEPAVRSWLLVQVDTETAEAVLASLAPVVRRVGAQAQSTVRLDENAVQAINTWVSGLVNGLLLDLAGRELELIALRAEVAQLRDRAAHWDAARARLQSVHTT